MIRFNQLHFKFGKRFQEKVYASQKTIDSTYEITMTLMWLLMTMITVRRPGRTTHGSWTVWILQIFRNSGTDVMLGRALSKSVFKPIFDQKTLDSTHELILTLMWLPMARLKVGHIWGVVHVSVSTKHIPLTRVGFGNVYVNAQSKP